MAHTRPTLCLQLAGHLGRGRLRRSAYEEKIRGFFLGVHTHEDEEIRYILSGSGFFDVRETPTDAWIRFAVAPGDLLVLPAGIYHRFALDTRDQIRVSLRLFKDGRKWIPHTRSARTDANVHRVGCLRDIDAGIVPAVGAVGA
ncbi:1,2-dihydroxy-3-keto-5-methylthiopentene dioxygenase [Mycena sanguinolenta]|uniref:acireductone dioxygenase (Fe(2+)-requiring) n=1 Tax=Mycena sanguinolenta TaxID=230812 RepID=A0A8H7CZ64_9AGAR|nr:1,2-dihydroxy-3-keto-5-methylthiopentene dioxygenase [Mycena sanguinolenta]